jgi:hypothetical protein
MMGKKTAEAQRTQRKRKRERFSFLGSPLKINVAHY